MTVDVAERLAALRKAHGYSQEELADKIGVSRQAVSKWERTESSPDTDNLIALANVYEMSLDELLGITKDGSGDAVFDDESKVNTDTDGESSTIELDLDNLADAIHSEIRSEYKSAMKSSDNKDHIFRKRKADMAEDIVASVSAVVIAITYLVLGFTTRRGWAIGWTLFLLVPVFSSLAEAIVKRDADEFCFPVLVVFSYLFGGMHWGLWHPYWIEFFAIPLYYIVVEFINKMLGKEKCDDDDDDDDEDDDDDNVVKFTKENGKVVITKNNKHISVDVPGVKIEVEKSQDDED